MTSSVSAVMEACGAGSLETIRGWNMLNGFLGKCFPSNLSSSWNGEKVPSLVNHL